MLAIPPHPTHSHLQHLAGEVDRNGAGAAAHAAQVIADDVGPHLEVVDHHGRQRGRRVEQAAVDHQDANLLGVDARLRSVWRVCWCGK